MIAVITQKAPALTVHCVPSVFLWVPIFVLLPGSRYYHVPCVLDSIVSKACVSEVLMILPSDPSESQTTRCTDGIYTGKNISGC